MAKKFTGKIPTIAYAGDLIKALTYFVKLN